MKNFSSSNLHPGIIDFLTEKSITVPTEIQAKAIPLLLQHNGDFVARSATGTGKTYAYGAPLLTRIVIDNTSLQAVILVPTRELCEQVGSELSALATHIPELKIEAIYGGVPLKAQVQTLSEGVHILVATPGRMMDLVQRGAISLASLDFMIFDEADEMLLKGFQTDIDKILDSTDRSYSTWLFSATMPDQINAIVNKYLRKKLKKTLIGKNQTTNEDIEHQAIVCKAEEKLSVLFHFLTQFDGQKGIIFCRTKSGVQKLYRQLSARKFSCGALHGNLRQSMRTRTMEQYRAGNIRLLVATDIASRGLDIPDVSFVIQYHIPDTLEGYTHRSGRTSRAGNTGISLTFIFPEETRKMSRLAGDLSLDFDMLSPPNAEDQAVNKAILWARTIAKTKPLGGKLEKEKRDEFKEQLSHLSMNELMEKLLAYYLSNG